MSTTSSRPPIDPIEELTYICPTCQAPIEIGTAVIGDTVDCPRCKAPFVAEVPSAEAVLDYDESKADAPSYEIDRPTDDETTLLEIHPAMFRRHPILFLAATIVLLAGASYSVMKSLDSEWMIAGLAAVVAVAAGGYLLSWRLEVMGTTLRITNKRTTLRRGLIAKNTTEVQHDDVRNLQVEQDMLQRLLGVGDIAISSSGQDDLEIHAPGIPDPNEVADLVRRMQ